jgi:hypothetical protein
MAGWPDWPDLATRCVVHVPPRVADERFEVPTVQLASDAAGLCRLQEMATGADRAAKEAYSAVEGDVRAVLARPAGGCQLFGGCPGSCGQRDVAPAPGAP